MRRAGKVVCGVIGLVAIIVGYGAFAALLAVDRLEIDGHLLFPPAFSEATDPADPPVGSEREVAVEVRNGIVSVRSEVTAPTSSEFIRDVGEGKLAETYAPAGFSRVEVLGRGSALPLLWSAPTVTTSSGATATAQMSATIALGDQQLAREIRVILTPAWCEETCSTKVVINSDDLQIHSATPRSAVTEQSATSLTAVSSGTGFADVDPFEVRLAPELSAADAMTEPVSLPRDLVHWAMAVAALIWAFLPWWLLRREVARHQREVATDHAREQCQRFLSSTRLLLLLVGIVILSVTISWSSSTLGGLARGLRETSGGVPEVAVQSVYAISTPVAIAPLAWWALWAGTCWRRALPRRGRLRPGWLVVSLGVAMLAGVTLVLPATAADDPSTSVYPDPSLAMAWLAAGSLLVGFVLLSTACGVRGAVPIVGGTVAGLVVGPLTHVYSANADRVGGLVTALVAAAVIVAMLWVTVSFAKPSVASAWRTTWWVPLLVAAVAVVVVAPSVSRPGTLSLFSPYDVGSFVAFVPLLIRVSLLALAVTLVTAIGPERVSRRLLVLLAAALVLRADDLADGVAWSFLVGLALIWTVLLPVDPVSATATQAVRSLSPERAQNTPARIRAVAEALAARRLERDVKNSLRAKVAGGDLEPDDAAAVRASVRGALASVPAPDRAAEIDALAWAGLGSPWGRAWRASMLAAALGLILTLATMLQSLEQVEGYVGYGTWGTVVSVLLNFRFPLYGLAFGLLYPAIPGRTGLRKAARLLVVLAVSEAVALSGPLAGSDLRDTALLRLVQLVVLCGVLGVAADLHVLRVAGRGPRELADLYQSSRLAVWSSGLLVATASAVATAMLSGAATLLVESLLPEPANTPAGVVSSRR